MELEEQDRREILERQKEEMIRQIAGATGQSAQMLRAMNQRRFNATPSSLIDDRSDEVNNLAQLLVDDHQAEQERRLQERLDLMRQQVNQGMGTDSDWASRVAGMRIPPSVLFESFLQLFLHHHWKPYLSKHMNHRHLHSILLPREIWIL